jgi:hypothetical protein
MVLMAIISSIGAFAAGIVVIGFCVWGLIWVCAFFAGLMGGR